MTLNILQHFLIVCIGYMAECTPWDSGDTRVTAYTKGGVGGLVKT